MPRTSSGRSRSTTKSAPWRLNASTGAGAPEPSAAMSTCLQVAAGDVGVLLGAGERELLLDDLLGQHEPGVVVARAHDVRERAERVEAREQRRRQPAAASRRATATTGRGGCGCRGGSRSGPSCGALGVVPHPVGVDDVPAGGLRDLEHPPVDVVGDARRSSSSAASPSRSGQLARTSSWLPPMPPEVTITAGARARTRRRPRASSAAPRRAPLGSSTSPRTPSPRRR